ncbi:MAG: hemerythrin domain-containing protein [Thermoanaerobaculia bacterium]|nr:hemerythrin domain-containing protein [Thermoanaerobaculia bacterium]
MTLARPLTILMDEHRLIETALGSLETCAIEVGGGLALERAIARDYAEFLRGYADAWHHGKEEDILFQRMVERGFSAEAGPVAVMLHEHRQGRALVSAIHAVGGAEGDVTAAERAAFVSAAQGFVPLLRQHIQKEDNILYPMSERVLSTAEFESMLADFEAFERKAGADGTRERLEALAERLAAAFRPDEARMAAGSVGGCWSCG